MDCIGVGGTLIGSYMMVGDVGAPTIFRRRYVGQPIVGAIDQIFGWDILVDWVTSIDIFGV